VRRTRDLPGGGVSAIRERLSAIGSQSERTILLGTVLLASSVSIVVAFLLTQYWSTDIPSALLYVPDDCQPGWDAKLGRHCFGDYALPKHDGMLPNPWEPYLLTPDSKPYHNNYTAAAMVPAVVFGVLGKWLGAPGLGLIGYLLVLAIAVLSPAVWAARGARGLERVVVFVACGVAAVPAWMVIDRGNSVGFVAPIALVFLVGLCRRRWGLVAVMVVLAALVKPQFAVLAVALFAARQWRWGGIAVAGAVIANLATYALWPRDFPGTITESIHNVGGYGSFRRMVGDANVSFAKGLFAIPDYIKAGGPGGKIPDGYLAGPRALIGYVVLMLVVACVTALGRRIPPIMAGIVLLAASSLFSALANRYYLVFVLAVAALVLRDPDGPPGTGIFDRLATVGGRRRAVGVCVSLAVALCIAQIPTDSPPVQVAGPIEFYVSGVVTTSILAPLLWLVTCGAIIVSYARRPAPSPHSDQGPAGEVPPDAPDAPDADVGSSPTSAPIAESSRGLPS